MRGTICGIARVGSAAIPSQPSSSAVRDRSGRVACAAHDQREDARRHESALLHEIGRVAREVLDDVAAERERVGRMHRGLGDDPEAQHEVAGQPRGVGRDRAERRSEPLPDGPLGASERQEREHAGQRRRRLVREQPEGEAPE